METHRLKPLSDNFDHTLFNHLYKDLQPLIKTLTYQIDSRRLGVTPDIIHSWFEDKLLFAFNKYCGKTDEGKLKGMLINSLRMFKYRMLRKAYNNIYENSIALDSDPGLINIVPSQEELSEHELFLSLAKEFLKKQLSEDAYLLLEITLNPPQYITSKMRDTNTKIPSKLLAEYLELEDTSYISRLRREMNQGILLAREYFSTESNLSKLHLMTQQ